jgi:multidrug efflux pump subunit AcrA (membrane-fusion protein)
VPLAKLSNEDILALKNLAKKGLIKSSNYFALQREQAKRLSEDHNGLGNFRTWTDRKGRTITAALSNLNAESVELITRGGEPRVIPFVELSDADQRFVMERHSRFAAARRDIAKREAERKRELEERARKRREEENARRLQEEMIARKRREAELAQKRREEQLAQKRREELAQRNQRASQEQEATPGTPVERTKFPSTELLSIGDVRKRAKAACNVKLHDYSAGVYFATLSVFEIEYVLLIARENVSESEYNALVRYGVYHKRVNGRGDPEDTIEKQFVGEWISKIDEQFQQVHGEYAETHKDLQGIEARSFWDERIKKLGLLAAVDGSGYGTPVGEYVKELARLRSDGPDERNDLSRLLGGKTPTISADNADGKPSIGSYVGKMFGIRAFQPYQWTGKIVGQQGRAWDVRVTWVNGNAPYVEGETYKMTSDEFTVRSGPSIGDKLNGY